MKSTFPKQSMGKLVEDKPSGKENTANFHTDVVTSAFSQDVKELAEDPCDDVALMPVV
ncbi:hypothetical protein K8O68_03100 [Salipaludibacillus sp. CUR1]|uniref:hypothetical protein n=1 Tax=Salipaludibacillus sp. CUR1 TaxID=2820003 RepID=UPI001E4A7E30|nr:hypothetical protein [Salipaludibacillus sp. CUR1]MCE7791410.1 hypothetical protein [Salipaludibacillus sp. CUR1]